jgi:hypothetical protein
VVTRAGHLGTWPLTVDSGTLSCSGSKILFKVGGITYSLNGYPGNGYADVNSILADDPDVPGLKMNVYSLVTEGEALC